MVARLRFPPDPIARIEARLLELNIPQPCIQKHIAALRSLQAKKAARRGLSEERFQHRVLANKGGAGK